MPAPCRVTAGMRGHSSFEARPLRGLARQDDAGRAWRCSEKTTVHESNADPGDQQHHVRRPAVSAVGRLLADLRLDANSEPDPRFAVHARRLCRRDLRRRDVCVVLQAEFLARGGADGCGCRGVRRPGRALPVAAAGGAATRAGAGDARHRVHDRRLLPDGMDRRSDHGARHRPNLPAPCARPA